MMSLIWGTLNITIITPPSHLQETSTNNIRPLMANIELPLCIWIHVAYCIIKGFSK